MAKKKQAKASPEAQVALDESLPEELRWAAQLSSQIFKEGLLLNVSIGFWEGKTQQDARDIEVLQAKIDNDIYSAGVKWLIPAKEMRVFTQFRSRLSVVLNTMSYRVPGLRGSRFVPKKMYKRITDFLSQEKELFFQQRDEFIKKYPQLRDERIKEFDAKYPEYAGSMNALYPLPEHIASRFHYIWIPYAWAYTDIQEIASDAQAKLAERSTELIYNAGLQIRNHIIEATEGVVKAIQGGKNTVNIRSVNSFSRRLEELKALNLFADPEVDKIIHGAASTLASISSWKKEDVDKTNLEQALGEIVRTLKKEVETIESNPEELATFKRAISVAVPDIEEAETEVDEPDLQVSRRVISVED